MYIKQKQLDNLEKALAPGKVLLFAVLAEQARQHCCSNSFRVLMSRIFSSAVKILLFRDTWPVSRSRNFPLSSEQIAC
jgi:hypothetical protein